MPNNLAARAATLARDVWTGALDLVFAPVCVACGDPIPTADPERMVCRMCWSRCRPLPLPRCARCWGPLPPLADAGPTCRACAEWPASVRAIRSAYAIGEAPRKLVHALKYQGWQALADRMGARMAQLIRFPADVDEEARLVVAVPTSAARRRERGYNQAELLAAAFAARTGRTPEPSLLVRTRAATTQTALHPAERRANVARAFTVPAGAERRLAGAHVMVVDDVWTTGATALSCVQALVQAGARVASVATFARVVPELERAAPP